MKLEHIEHLIIDLPDHRGFSYGCNQQWYPRKWQQLSGCAPTIASTMIMLMMAQNQIPRFMDVHTKEDAITLMQRLWSYVTPTWGGVSTTTYFAKSLSVFFDSIDLKVNTNILDIPAKSKNHLDFDPIVSFIETALSKDMPIAFLNLDHGDQVALESWHWTIIVSYSQERTNHLIELVDNGKIKVIDIHRWFLTTKKGGGLVSLEPTPSKNHDG